MLDHTFECGGCFACLFPGIFQLQDLELRNQKKYFLNIDQVFCKKLLSSWKDFHQMRVDGFLQVESGHSFFLLRPIYAVRTLLSHPSKKSGFIFLEVSWGGRFSSLLISAKVRNYFCGFHTRLTLILCGFQRELAPMQLGLSLIYSRIYSTISFFDIFQIEISRPSFSCAYLAFEFANTVSWSDVRITDRRLWDGSCSLKYVLPLCRFYTLPANYRQWERQSTFPMLYDSFLLPRRLDFSKFIPHAQINRCAFVSLSLFEIIFTLCHKYAPLLLALLTHWLLFLYLLVTTG